MVKKAGGGIFHAENHQFSHTLDYKLILSENNKMAGEINVKWSGYQKEGYAN